MIIDFLLYRWYSISVAIELDPFGNHFEARPVGRPVNSKGVSMRRWHEPAYDPFGRSWKHIFILIGLALAVASLLIYTGLHGAFDSQFDWMLNQKPNTCTEQTQDTTPNIDTAAQC